MEANIVLEKKQENDITIEDLKQEPTAKFSKLIFNETLDYIPANELMDLLFAVKSKLLPEGIIVIQSYDLYELMYAILNDVISTIEFNQLIEKRKQLLTVPDLNFILSKLGFKILSKDIDANRYLIEGQNGV